MAVQDERIRKSLRYSIFDGTFSALMIGFGESFFVPFALFLRANSIQIGVLSSLPQTLGSVLQIFSSTLIRFFGSRKKLVATAALLQGLMYIPVTFVFFFGTLRIYLLIGFVCLYWIFGMMLSPAWNSWMGDLTAERERGAYFGRRSKITGAASFFAFLTAGYILQKFGKDTSAQYGGFVVIFLFACISRIISSVYLWKEFEPEFAERRKPESGFVTFVRKARFGNYGLFALYLSLMNFSVYLSAPFFTPYLLNDLKFSYWSFTIINAAAIIVKVFSIPVWGKAADRFGAKRVLSLTGFLMPLVPLLWLFSGDFLYLILIQFYSGFIWGGFEISSFSFIFDATTPETRATDVAYYNTANGVALVAGAMIGSLLVRYNAVFWSKYLFVFAVSGLLRYLASALFIRKLREVREVEMIPYSRLFLKVISNMPTMGLVYQLIPFRRKQRE